MRSECTVNQIKIKLDWRLLIRKCILLYTKDRYISCTARNGTRTKFTSFGYIIVSAIQTLICLKLLVKKEKLYYTKMFKR